MKTMTTMTTMTTAAIESGSRERLARNVEKALQNVQLGMERVYAGDTVSAQLHLTHANEALQNANCSLQAEGTKGLDGVDVTAALALPLLDTPATRRLLDALHFAMTWTRNAGRCFLTGRRAAFPMEPPIYTIWSSSRFRGQGEVNKILHKIVNKIHGFLCCRLGPLKAAPFCLPA